MGELQDRLNQPLLKQIIPLLPAEQPVYLVGGAVRDALLGRQSYDLDFVTSGDAMKIARHLADDLGAAYFPLDIERKVARLVLRPGEKLAFKGSTAIRVDFSAYQGRDLLADLQGRDFTMNAMAIEVHQMQVLVDPLGGAKDLVAKRLRACSPKSFLKDPVRILRAVRFSVDLELKIIPDTLHLMKAAISHLPEVSVERLRDELFRILTVARPATSLRLLDSLSALECVLPEVRALKDLQQSPPHTLDAWNHTLDLLSRMETLLDVLTPDFEPDKASNLTMGLVVLRLGRYRQQLAEHLSNSLNPDRPHRALLFLAGLYHDVGKVETQAVDPFGKIRFLGHDQIGGKVTEERGKALKLSKLETNRLATIVRYHMRPSLLSHPEDVPSTKVVYHFFRDTGAAGVDICIISLADVLATYGYTLPQDRWSNHVDVVRKFLGFWWDDRQAVVFPAPLVNGDDLLEELGLTPSPTIGYLLESIREAQIGGEIHDRNEALIFARKILDENSNKKTG